MHTALLRQLRKLGLVDELTLPDAATWAALLEHISDSYAEADQDRYLLERSLDLSSQEMHDLYKGLENAVEGISRLDLTQRYVDFNRAFAVMLGYGMDDLLGRAWLSLFHPDDWPALTDAHRQMLDGEKVEVECRALRRDGTTLHQQVSIVATRQLDGQCTGYYCFTKDITVQKQIQTQRLISDRMASVGMVASGVGHEINNPLATVVLNLEMALAGVQGLPALAAAMPDLGEMLADAAMAAQRMAVIVKDLRLFSRVEAAPTTLVDVRSVLDRTARIARNEILHRARLTKHYEDVPLVPGDEGRLAQVFRNLMINAAQSIPEGAAATNEISIAVRQEPQGYVAITVADSGCGMTAEVREHLFSPFFTTKSIGLGTGLGLSICQRIVMDLGGRIDVESEVGKGTAFRVLLPIATPDVTPAGMR